MLSIALLNTCLIFAGSSVQVLILPFICGEMTIVWLGIN